MTEQDQRNIVRDMVDNIEKIGESECCEHTLNAVTKLHDLAKTNDILAIILTDLRLHITNHDISTFDYKKWSDILDKHKTYIEKECVYFFEALFSCVEFHIRNGIDKKYLESIKDIIDYLYNKQLGSCLASKENTGYSVPDDAIYLAYQLYLMSVDKLKDAFLNLKIQMGL